MIKLKTIGVVMVRKTTTKIGKPTVLSLFEKQKEFQRLVLSKLPESSVDEVSTLPCDSTYWFKYHTLAMLEELGEVLRADKRWKTHRNDRYDRDEELDELSDVFITFINMCLYSGVDAEEICRTTIAKMSTNCERITR